MLEREEKCKPSGKEEAHTLTPHRHPPMRTAGAASAFHPHLSLPDLLPATGFVRGARGAYHGLGDGGAGGAGLTSGLCLRLFFRLARPFVVRREGPGPCCCGGCGGCVSTASWNSSSPEATVTSSSSSSSQTPPEASTQSGHRLCTKPTPSFNSDLANPHLWQCTPHRNRSQPTT